MNVSTNITHLLPQLHADSAANLYHWTECELVTFLDEAAKNLAQTTSLFIGRDISIALVAGQQLYAVPARHVATLFVNHAGKPLIPTSTHQLEMLDPRFANAPSGTPERWYEDKQAGGKIGIYPPPDPPAATGELAIIMIEYRATLDCDGAQTTMVVPVPIEDYFETYATAKAWLRDSDLKCPEVGNHQMERARLMERVIRSYWGTE